MRVHINKDFDLSCSKAYKIPIDPVNKFAISIHYYSPSPFTVEKDDNPWNVTNELGVQIIKPLTKWGDENDYKVTFLEGVDMFPRTLHSEMIAVIELDDEIELLERMVKENKKNNTKSYKENKMKYIPKADIEMVSVIENI